MASTLLIPEPRVAPVDAQRGFVERRGAAAPGARARERRQFSNSHENLSPEAAELAHAIDHYKASHRRRFIDFEEMLGVIRSLGYEKTSQG